MTFAGRRFSVEKRKHTEDEVTILRDSNPSFDRQDPQSHRRRPHHRRHPAPG